MKAIGIVAAVLPVLVACTSTRMVQREGCWVRQTEKWPGRVSEELGFCTKPPPVWAQDRVARLVQECMAQADFRWQDRDSLRSVSENDREYLKQSSDKMISALGEAAKKPPPSAVATATSTGTAKTESDLRSSDQPPVTTAPATVVEVHGPPAQPVAVPMQVTVQKAPVAPRTVATPTGCPARKQPVA